MKRNLSDYAKQRLTQRAKRIEREKQYRKDRLKMIAWVLADALAWVILVIAITALAMLDSVSFVPGIVLGVTVIYLAVYGAIRGVLG